MGFCGFYGVLQGFICMIYTDFCISTWKPSNPYLVFVWFGGLTDPNIPSRWASQGVWMIPMTDPWDWNIYVHEWLIFTVK